MNVFIPLLLCSFCAVSCTENTRESQEVFEQELPGDLVTSTPPHSLFLATPDGASGAGQRNAKEAVWDGAVDREELVVFAKQHLGTPYVYAASDPNKGFDCSGFIYYVYQHFGISVPRSSIDFKNYGREVPLSNARVADLILFTGASDTDRIGHIGIVLQAGSDTTQFIHASSGTEMAVTISAAASPHYRKRFVKVVDVISK